MPPPFTPTSASAKFVVFAPAPKKEKAFKFAAAPTTPRPTVKSGEEIAALAAVRFTRVHTSRCALAHAIEAHAASTRPTMPPQQEKVTERFAA